ncbi:hypothetical protein HMPREF1557_00164 [Streptococcus sobrinus W1703]|uniref:Uncharacterized protein n=1 Tax=Streptococcus sobrinus W1703 TaxID=1227275 RepID=U2KNX2_9STRE|nr:hypothetical protein HMPREF1557_00164 [Streptococcus sobrinus W1703]
MKFSRFFAQENLVGSHFILLIKVLPNLYFLAKFFCQSLSVLAKIKIL